MLNNTVKIDQRNCTQRVRRLHTFIAFISLIYWTLITLLTMQFLLGALHYRFPRNVVAASSSSRRLAPFSPIARPSNDSYNHARYLSSKSCEGTSNMTDRTDVVNAYIAVGSNMGDRFKNIMNALTRLSESEGSFIKVKRTSFLHETKPMYVLDQPAFLNGAFQIETNLPAPMLLQKLKLVERDLGRNCSNQTRNGPRPIDLDIIFYGNDSASVIQLPDIQIPHPRIQEREFVLTPMSEIDRDARHPLLNKTIQELLQDFKEQHKLEAVRVVPLPRGRMLAFNETIVMGILNVTPDSFSDGGKVSLSA